MIKYYSDKEWKNIFEINKEHKDTTKNTHIAVLEVGFKKSDMVDEETLKQDFNNSLWSVMKFLYEEENIGLFDQKIELIKLKKIKRYKKREVKHEK